MNRILTGTVLSGMLLASAACAPEPAPAPPTAGAPTTGAPPTTAAPAPPAELGTPAYVIAHQPDFASDVEMTLGGMKLKGTLARQGPNMRGELRAPEGTQGARGDVVGKGEPVRRSRAGGELV